MPGLMVHGFGQPVADQRIARPADHDVPLLEQQFLGMRPLQKARGGDDQVDVAIFQPFVDVVARQGDLDADMRRGFLQ